ncbi:MAG: TfoX/Sxy family protein [Defluviitaleaceae bacterium]|nr:TfoX/Sxy family protein [Defluviitaleaceae bacterium]
MSDLKSMRNIGRELEKKLNQAGISTPDELRQIGSEDAFLRVKVYYPNICLVHLMALEGAVCDIEYNQLPEEVQARLKAFCDGLG